MLTYNRRAMTANRTKRASARHWAKVGAFASDGLALVATLALIYALYLLAGVLASDRASYALLVNDGGNVWVMDYDLTYDDCALQRANYRVGVATCDLSKG